MPRKHEIPAHHEAKAAKIVEQFKASVILEKTCYEELVKPWLQCTEEVASDIHVDSDERNTVYRMADSGARGSWSQIQQTVGIHGPVSDPKQKLTERPIRVNYRESLTVLEYFIAMHGARKGLVDTVLRIAESDYLTRCLVDASQGAIAHEVDHDTHTGPRIDIAHKNEFGK